MEQSLAQYPILECTLEDYKSMILNSLKKGNLQRVTFEIEGKEEIRYIEAAPRYKSINIYDENFRKLFKTQDHPTTAVVAKQSPETSQQKTQPKQTEQDTKPPKVKRKRTTATKKAQTVKPTDIKTTS